MKEKNVLPCAHMLQNCSSPVLKILDGGPVPHPKFLRPASYSSAANVGAELNVINEGTPTMNFVLYTINKFLLNYRNVFLLNVNLNSFIVVIFYEDQALKPHLLSICNPTLMSIEYMLKFYPQHKILLYFLLSDIVYI